MVVFILLSSSVLAYDYSKLKKEDYAVNSVIIKFNSSTKIKNFNDAKLIIDKIDKDEKKIRKLTDSYDETPYGSNFIYLIKYKKNIDVIKKIEQLSKHKEVEYAEPDIAYTLEEILPNDQGFSSQWYLNNSKQSVGGTIGLLRATINATQAWNITTGGALVKIAILDSGINKTHSDLLQKIDNYNTSADVMEQNTYDNGCYNGTGEDCDGISGRAEACVGFRCVRSCAAEKDL